MSPSLQPGRPASPRPRRLGLDAMALVLSGFALAGTAWQVREVIKTREAAERSARAADASAKAAERVERVTQAGLRARVTVSKVTLQQPLGAKQPVMPLIELENSGHSDARNVQLRIAASVGATFPSGQMPLALAPIGSPGLLPAGATSTTSGPIPGSEQTTETVRSLVAGQTSLFVYGMVSYETFEERHETRFCVAPSVTNSAAWAPCPEWNDAR
jgi:hypothetical protein